MANGINALEWYKEKMKSIVMEKGYQKNYAESKEDDENNPSENNDFSDGFEDDAKDASDTNERESDSEDDEDRGLNINADQLDLFGDGNDDEE